MNFKKRIILIFKKQTKKKKKSKPTHFMSPVWSQCLFITCNYVLYKQRSVEIDSKIALGSNLGSVIYTCVNLDKLHNHSLPHFSCL